MTNADSESPIEELVFVLKKGEKRGPYTVDEIFDLLESGELAYEDVCLRDGAAECERIRDILDWEREEQEQMKLAPVREKVIHEKREEVEEEEEQPQPRSRNRPLYTGYPSIITFPLALIGILVGVIGGIWLSALGEWITLSGFLIALLSFAYITFKRSMRQYSITARRVEVSIGIFAKSSKEALIADIRAINVVRRGFAGMIGIGTVEFNTTGDEPEVIFYDIWAANRVKSLVREIQDAD